MDDSEYEGAVEDDRLFFFLRGEAAVKDDSRCRCGFGTIAVDFDFCPVNHFAGGEFFCCQVGEVSV